MFKMFSLWIIFILCFSTSSVISLFPEDEVQSQASNEVKNRLLGEDVGKVFRLTVDRNYFNSDKDSFSVVKRSNEATVEIVGNSGVSACWGFLHYLKYYLNLHVSWDGDNLNLPKILPNVNLTKTSFDKWRFYQNVVTSSYSFVWWNWTRWEREIDWMALNGINIALAFTGQETIWQRVYDGLNIENDFTGPGFLAWNRMGNMRTFGGKLTQNWHLDQIDLQHKILERMRSLGITPVIPAFSGFLPHTFSKMYPLAKVTNISRWNTFEDKFCCPLLLDPNDPMFFVVSRLFLREYIEEYGTDHVYSCDTFNENEPLSHDLGYLSGLSRAVYDGMSQVDPNAIWLLQGWMFIDPFWGDDEVRAYITSIPIGRLLILDLQSELTPQYERLDSYYGQPFIWCMLHNFGGQLGMYGYLSTLNTGVIHGRYYQSNSTMVGIGVVPEGIDQNYIMYDFMLESPLRNETVNLTTWVYAYTCRRYGFCNSYIGEAWQILKDTLYNFEGTALSVTKKNRPANNNPSLYGIHLAHNVLTKRPSLRLFELVWYDKAEVFRALSIFVEHSNTTEVVKSKLFWHDAVDLTRQVLQLHIATLYESLVLNFRKRDVKNFQETAEKFLGLFDDLDVLLGTNKKFLLGPWLESAKLLAKTSNESKNYEYNARNQITLWGPNGEIRDYAAKQWAGLIVNYYKPRWEIFIKYLNNSLFYNKKINSSAMNKEMFDNVELPFTVDNSTYPTEVIGNSQAIIYQIYEKIVNLRLFSEKIVSHSKRYIPDIVSLVLI